MHTLTNGYLISSAGIDTNNGNGHYILWPHDPQKTAAELLEWFKKEFDITTLYLVITDSRSVMLRRGAMGCAIAWAGFEPLYYHAKEKDVFGKEVGDPYTTNLPDSIAAAAVLVMGEVAEQTPLAIVRGVPYLGRQNKSLGFTYELTVDEDIYAPFLKNVPWEEGGEGKD
jgi:F420-0:gamma-glutamyl ligase